MSAATTQALEEAIRTHIADEYPDALVAEWALIVAAVEAERERGEMLHIYEDNDLPSHHATGLLTRAINRIEHEEVTT